MLFCPKCGSIMMPKKIKDKTFLSCSKCGNIADAKGVVISEKCNAKRECVEVVEKFETRPLAEVECPKCGHMKARTWERQMRAADEPATKFFECEKCKRTWRDSL